MGDWYYDPWLEKAGEMGEEFFQQHRDVMPESLHDVWEENEITYFVHSFVLWSAQTKFRVKDEELFLKRAEQYRQNVKSSFEDESRGWAEESSFEFGDYETYLRREKEYMTILMNSSSSLFKTIPESSIKAACKLFIDKSCKQYVFSEKDFVKIISPWLVNKSIEFQRDLKLSYEGD